MSEFWLVSLPLEGSTADSQWRALQDATSPSLGPSDLAVNARVAVPELRVGTLDSLLALSDDLSKVSLFVEGTVNKIGRQLADVAGEAVVPSVEGQPLDSYLSRFQWDEAKYPVKSQLRETVDKIFSSVTKMEEALKSRTGEYNAVKGSLAAAARKATGSMAVRDVSSLVTERDVVETENLTTLVVVVPKHAEAAWTSQYESLAQFVVPRSSKKVSEDSEAALWSVVLFRRVVDDFKSAARDKGFQARDFTYDPSAAAASASERERLESEFASRRRALEQWCQTSYGEVFAAWAHVCVVRLFVESILRYGLPPQFLAAAVRPNKRQEKKLRDALAGLCGGSSAGHWANDDDAAQMGSIGGLTMDDVHPYVSITMTLQSYDAMH